MSQTGKFIFKKFLGKTVELYNDFDSEWLVLEQVSVYNKFTVIGIVNGYDEETDILELLSINNLPFYVNAESIQFFWEYGNGFKLLDNLNRTIESGRNFSFDKHKYKEKMDSGFNKHIASLKKPKI